MSEDRRLEAGFTFIEIIIAITILAMIILTVYNLLDMGLSFKDYIDNSHWSYHELQLVMGRMAKDLRSTFYRSQSEGFPDKYPFTGNMYQVSFFSRSFDSEEVEHFFYQYSPYDQILYLHRGGKEIPLINDLARCNFYFYNGQHEYWDNYWDSKDKGQPPLLVRIEFVLNSSAQEFSFDFPIYVQQKGLSRR